MRTDALLIIALVGLLVIEDVPADPKPVQSRPASPATTAPSLQRPSTGEPTSRQPSQAGRAFIDCADCPRMVVIPSGSFMMGSPEDEPGRRQYEGPQRTLSIATFAVSETEITRGRYAAFAQETNRPAAGGCYTHGDGTDDISDLVLSASWRDPGFEQTLDHPVVCVSWRDAKDYAAWLAGKTGQNYRLPSEAEWEYAARAGTTTAFFWGESADRDCVHMNGGDHSLVRAVPAWQGSVLKALRAGDPRARLVECDDGSPFTSVVGRYEPNPFGLRDIIGNAWEWVEDCWSESLPMVSHAQTAGTCDHRTRGGSWDDFPEDLRSARRSRLAPDVRRSDVGIRLARTLSVAEAGSIQADARAGTRDGYVTLADGVRIHYIERGAAGALPPLLLIPGWGMDAAIWKGQIAEFSPSRRVVAFDPRSQGESTKTPEGNTPEARAGDLRQIIRQLELDRVVLVGWSQGVQDIAAYVGQFGLDGIAGVVLVDAAVSAGPAAVELQPQATQQLLGHLGIYAAYPREYLEGMMKAIFSKPLSGDELRLRVETAAKTPTSIGIAMLASDMLAVDRRPTLAKFDKPTLIIAASTSSELQEQKDMARRVANGEFVAIDDAGHAVFVDQPERFNDAVAAFLDKLEKRG